MHPGTRREPDVGRFGVVVERVKRGTGRRFEQHEQAIGPADLAAAVSAEKVARPAVML